VVILQSILKKVIVKDLIQYDIDIFGLPNKTHEYEFESGDAFFQELEQELIESGSFRAKLSLNKSETMIIVDFVIDGNVNLICDRSLEIFAEPINLKDRLIYKYGDHNEVLTDEIEVIRQGTAKLSLAAHVFEFIALSLPMKKLLPRFRNDDSEAEEILVYSSSQTEEPETIDPRWAGLNKLK
jgi:uncharacterized metal-binding protein YceD (DUF177 family)